MARICFYNCPETSIPPLYSRANVVTSHAVVPGSIPSRVNFLVEVFFRRFPSTVIKMSGNLGHIRPRLSHGHHVSSKSHRVFGNSSYKLLGLVEGTEYITFLIGTLVRKRTVFVLQVQQVQCRRLNLLLLPGIK